MMSVLWLVDYLNKKTEQTILIVTHDRYLMNEVADEIILMRNKTLVHHPGNYNSFEMHTQQRAQWKLRMYEVRIYMSEFFFLFFVFVVAHKVLSQKEQK